MPGVSLFHPQVLVMVKNEPISGATEPYRCSVIHPEQPGEFCDEWATKIEPALKQVPLKVLVKECQEFLSRRALIDLRAGRCRPHRKNQKLLVSILKQPGLL